MINLRNSFLTLKRWLFPHGVRDIQQDPYFILYKLYTNVNATRVSHAERDRLGIKEASFVYGEITAEGFSAMLKVVAPQPCDIFYDLGSGSGKAVLCAALLYDWKKCVGVELLPGLYELSLGLHKQLLGMAEIQQFFPGKTLPVDFVCDDILQVDFSEADVIFVNATTFNIVLWEQLQKRFAALKSGARLMTTTRKLNEWDFELIHQGQYLMSWDYCTVFFYKRK